MRKPSFIDEMEWWDRLATAVDLLEKRPGLARRDVTVTGRTLRWIGDPPPPEGSSPAVAAAPAATGYVFPSIKDVEILRRITQMPDETPLDMLAIPFSVYCPEMKSFVSVNDPSTSLEDHLKILEETPS